MSTTLVSPSPGPCRVEPALRVRASRPDLQPDTPAFRAAVVLLAGPLCGFNIDRVARRCAIPRAIVAACVRRLIDNGVWAGGTAVVAWSGPDDPRFWNDAAVAQGRLLRRARPDGSLEWAPAGSWDKAFDYVGPQGDPGGAVLYLDAAPDPAPRGHVSAPCPAAPTAGAAPAFAPAQAAEDGFASAADGSGAARPASRFAVVDAEEDGFAKAAHGLGAARPAYRFAVVDAEADGLAIAAEHGRPRRDEDPPRAARVPAPRIAAGAWPDGRTAEAELVAAGGSRLPELFPGANWLG